MIFPLLPEPTTVSRWRDYRRNAAYVLPVKKGFGEISSSRRHDRRYRSWTSAVVGQ